MKNILLIILTFIIANQSTDKAYLDKLEAQKAFDLLNKVRQSPGSYYQDFKFNPQVCVQRPPLKWNDTLAIIAEQKALDMAINDYYGHVDPKGFSMNYYIHQGGYKLDSTWLTDPKENNFESICANYETGELAIKGLIIDKNTPSLGHRFHLLGHGKWNESLEDIGIGFARSSGKTKYKTYVCVLIAKHR